MGGWTGTGLRTTGTGIELTRSRVDQDSRSSIVEEGCRLWLAKQGYNGHLSISELVRRQRSSGLTGTGPNGRRFLSLFLINHFIYLPISIRYDTS